MQDIFLFNSNLNAIDIKDAIHSRLNQPKAILTCVMFASEFVCDDINLNSHTIYHAVWAADNYLEEIELLFQRLEEL